MKKILKPEKSIMLGRWRGVIEPDRCELFLIECAHEFRDQIQTKDKTT